EEEAAGPRAAGPVGVDEAPPADERIRARLAAILEETGAFDGLSVSVRHGVVTLDGVAADERHVELASEVARQTEGVVAGLNRLEVRAPLWSLAPARDELRDLARELIRALPTASLGLLVVLLGWLASRAAARLARPVLLRRLRPALLREVAIRAVGLVVLLAG